MDDILSYEPRREEDFYSILGCHDTATIEQIQAEYKCRARACHPDKNPDDAEKGPEFALLQHAKSVLVDPKQRADYDKWRLSGLAMGYNEWKARRQHIHTSLHWAQKVQREPMLMDVPSDRDLGGYLSDSVWQRQPASETLRRFRNYDI